MSFIDLNEGGEEPTFVREIVTSEDYRLHEMSDGSFLVFKDVASDPSYIIEPGSGCNCPSAQYRAGYCKHEKMAGFAGKEDIPVEDDIIAETGPEPEQNNEPPRFAKPVEVEIEVQSLSDLLD